MEEEEDKFIVSIVEHQSSLTVGVAALSLTSAKVVLANIHDSGSYVETLTHLLQFRVIPEIIMCQTNAGSTLTAKVKGAYTLSTVTTLPRSDFNEVQGSLLLRQLASPHSSIGQSTFLDNTLFLAHAALSGLVKEVQRNGTPLLPGTLEVKVSSGHGRVFIDPETVKHLELLQNVKTLTKDGSLFKCLDYTRTKGGRRLLVNNIIQPLCDKQTLEERLDAVAEMLGNERLFFSLTEVLKTEASTTDFEALSVQLCSKPKNKTARYGEQLLRRMVSLKTGLTKLPTISKALEQSKTSRLLRTIRNVVSDEGNNRLLDQICQVLNKDASLGTAELCFSVRPNIDPFLDVSRKEYSETAEDIQRLFQTYQQAAGEGAQIQLRHTKKHGFFIEWNGIGDTITNKEPPFQNVLFLQQQGNTRPNTQTSTTKGRRMFTTKELNSLSKKNSDAYVHIAECSSHVLEQLLIKIAPYAPVLVRIGEALSRLDLVQSLATFAVMCPGGACRPEFTENGPIAIKQGRHPLLNSSTFHAYIPNDVFQPGGVQLITGPNMSGKSTYLRQVGLLSVLAHIGSYVPAEFASFRLLTHIVTRMGGNEQQMDGGPPPQPSDLTLGDGRHPDGCFVPQPEGPSHGGAFFKEVEEICTVLSMASERTLILIDEFGRATSATGGAALAWALAEHLAVKTHCLGFFVTHYFDVVQGLELLYGEQAEGYRNRAGVAPVVTTRHFLVDKKDGIHPLFAMSVGVSHDYLGVEMAESSGLPEELIRRAYQVRETLRKKAREEEESRRKSTKHKEQETTLSRRVVAQQLLNLEHSTLDEAGLRAYIRDLKNAATAAGTATTDSVEVFEA